MNSEQNAPVPNDAPSVWPLVIEDMHERHEVGIQRYGTPLQPFNGRRAIVDAYQESLDQTVYLRQAIAEMEDVSSVLRSMATYDRLPHAFVVKLLEQAERLWPTQ